MVMFRVQIQWIRPAPDTYVEFLQTIVFLQCLNECINDNSDRAAWENCRLVRNEKKLFLRELFGSVGGQGQSEGIVGSVCVMFFCMTQIPDLLKNVPNFIMRDMCSMQFVLFCDQQEETATKEKQTRQESLWTWWYSTSTFLSWYHCQLNQSSLSR